MAGAAGLEPVTSAVTGQRSNQLSYAPAYGAGERKKSDRSRQVRLEQNERILRILHPRESAPPDEIRQFRQVSPVAYSSKNRPRLLHILVRAADAKEVGVGNPAEETCCHPNGYIIRPERPLVNLLSGDVSCQGGAVDGRMRAEYMTTNLEMKSAGAVRVAVLGTGSLGKEHARIYSELAAAGKAEFAGVYDVVPETTRKIADNYRVRAFGSVDEAAAASDALSVVTPTTTHYELARMLMEQGKHVLLEKPMTHDAAQAAELVQLAQKRNCLLQVGHVERFNPVFNYLGSVATEPRFIEAHRLSPYPKRSTDIGVVLDLMIHDLDVILAFVKSPVTSVDAVGIPLLSKSEDIANARLRFANGCVANLTASRVSPDRMRKIRVFSGGLLTSYISLDYRAQEGFIYRVAREGEEESSLLEKLLHANDSTIVSEFAGKRIVREPVPIAKEEPLKLELEHFIECVRAHRTPLVSGESAKRALDLALEITGQVSKEWERVREEMLK
jgi:predicted dehydrogenase